MIRSLLFILFITVISLFNSISAQSLSEEWVSIKYNNSDKILIDVSNLSSFKGNIFYVWSMEFHYPPIEVEAVDDDVYRTKTFYLINKEIKRYSIIEVIYYDEDDNVMKSFSYKRDSTIEKYQYNFPILPGSEMESLLSVSNNYLGK